MSHIYWLKKTENIWVNIATEIEVIKRKKVYFYIFNVKTIKLPTFAANTNLFTSLNKTLYKLNFQYSVKNLFKIHL